MSAIKIITLTPKGNYADGSPMYDFHAVFPSKNVRALPEVFDTVEAAHQHGRKYILDYENKNFPGGMGAVLGVVKLGKDPAYKVIINTYYSFS